VPVKDAWANTVEGRRRTTASVRHFRAFLITGRLSLQLVGKDGDNSGVAAASSPLPPQGYPRRRIRGAKIPVKFIFAKYSPLAVWLRVRIGMVLARKIPRSS